MKILFSHYSIIEQGGFNRTYMLANELEKLGNSVTLLTSQKDRYKVRIKKSFKNKVLIVATPCFSRKLCSLGLDPINIIIRIIYSINQSYDIVHSDSGHRPAAGLPCHFQKILKGTTHIGEWWDFFGKGGQFDNKPFLWKFSYGQIDNWLEVSSKKKCNGIVTLSEYTKARAVSKGISKNRITIIRGGADVQNIKYYPATTFRKHYNIPENKLVFVFTGANATELQDLDPFFEALFHFKDQVILITTGEKILSTRFSDYNDLILEFGWLTYDEYTKLISCADVFLLLQKENLKNIARWPNKIGDYFAVGRLIMANPFGEIKTLYDKYPSSFIPVKWDANSIKDAISQLIIIRETIASLGFRNRQIALNELNWKNRALELLQFYHEIQKL